MKENKEYLHVDIEIVYLDAPDILTTSVYGESKEDESGWTTISDWA